MIKFENKETELKFNALAREQFISKLLKELEVDLLVCSMATENPIKQWGIYIKKIKTEIDRLYERVVKNDK